MLDRYLKFIKKNFFLLTANNRARKILCNIKKLPEGPFSKSPAVGYMRGIDYYDSERLVLVLANVLAWYRASCGKFPNLEQPSSFTEKLNYAKFFSAMRVPQTGNKCFTESFIPRDLANRVFYPQIVWRSNLPKLPRNSEIENGVYFLKTNHGSGMVRRIVYPLSIDVKTSIEREFSAFLNVEYGAELGEWWYNVFERELIMEKAVCLKSPPTTLLFFVISGEVTFISVDQKPLIKGQITRTLYFDEKFNLESIQRNGDERINSFEIPDDQKKETIEIAEQIGKQFESIRVDLIIGDDNKIYLNEITHTSNCGQPFYNRELDISLGKKWKGNEIYRF